jgi:hypothetical protein
MSTKRYCDRCGSEMSYPRNSADLHVYHDELRGKSYSLQVSMTVISPTNEDCENHFCEGCVIGMCHKALVNKLAERALVPAPQS